MSQLFKGIPVLDWIVRVTLGTKNQRDVKRYLKIVDQVNALEPEMRVLTDAQLRAKTEEFRTRVAGGEKPYAMIPEIFAAAREAMDRGVGIRNIFNPAKNADLNMDGTVDELDRFDSSLQSIARGSRVGSRRPAIRLARAASHRGQLRS
jgi:hypothetical protein